RDARPTWRIVAGLSALMGAKFKYNTSEDVFNEIASRIEAFKGMSYRTIGSKGMLMKQPESVSVSA
ncbi:MAG TPA: hypothetical protein VNL69_07410, partial [Bacteroidota bacterium]|nr:hypothetical protein [Bacteroidota bacterium]